MERPTLHVFVFGLLAILVFAAESHAISITEGDVVVENLSSFGFDAGSSFFSTDGGVTDEIKQMFAYIGNATGVVVVDMNYFDVVSAITANANIATSTVSLNASGAAVLGLAVGDIEIDFTFTLIDDTGPLDQDQFTWGMDITNMSTATLDLVAYTYLDLNLGGHKDRKDDKADADIYRIMVRDPDDPNAFMWESIDAPADHFELGLAGDVRNTLNNMTAATDLSDTSATFGPGDLAFAFQHDLLNLLAGNTATLGYGVVATPEPGSGALLGLGLAGLAAAGRRRR